MAKKIGRQLSLPGFGKSKFWASHGGEHTKGKRKSRRPFDPKQALHVVLSSSRARGSQSMLHPRHCNHIHGLLGKLKASWNISVYRYANVGNHLHLLIRARSHEDWKGFIREFSGGIAMLVTGAKKGSSLKRVAVVRKANESSREPPESAKRGFWDGLVFTRIVSFGRDFKCVANYVATNLWEGAGLAVRKLLNRGYQVLEISEEGFLLVGD